MHGGLTDQILRTMPLFKDMGQSRYDLIADNSHFIHLEKDDFAIHKGDACTGFYITVYGNIKISFISSEGKEHVVRIIGPGQSFSEAMMFLDELSPTTVQAITAAKVLFIPKNIIFQCISDDSSCMNSMFVGLSRRILLLASELESITLDSSRQRVISYLLQHLQPEDVQLGKRSVALPANKATIALHLNLAPETFSRILHELSENGLLQVDGKVIRILDIEKFRNLN